VECVNHADAESVNDGVLWITDFEDAADYLLKCGCGVLIYLHADNRDASFVGARYAFENIQELSPEYLERVYRRYAGIPWDILDTERCLIRETKESDIEAFYEIYNEPSITHYMENLYEDRDEEREYIRTYIDKVYGFYEFGVWTVMEKKSGNIIGRAGLSYREGFEEPELGFVIGVPWQRQGYAYEVCCAILEYAKEELGFDRVQVLVEPENTASVSLCEKLGFTDSHSINVEGKGYIRMLRSSQMSGR
jgi:RimJ/RimL family protein N-acetyltransferase